MKQLAVAAVLLASLALSACVLHVGGDTDDSHRPQHRVAAQETRNRATIGRLPLGTPLEQVLERLGEPDFADATQVGGEELRILRYRTHRSHADGDTSRDETTPLVFRNGRLSGIGERAAACTPGLGSSSDCQ